MTLFKKPTYFNPALPLLPGLLTAQAIATIQVYLSNIELLAGMKAIKDAGFLTVPNQNVMSHLQRLGPALCGGLFFTMSIGAGISLFSMAAAWIWDRIFFRNKYILFVFLLLWIGSLGLINLRGFSLLVTLYLLLIPPLVFLTAIKWMPLPGRQARIRDISIHVLPVFVLAGLWFTQYDQYLFLDLRDYLLLSNPIGKKVSDFYYRYTLYSAEVFKSLNQKLLKTFKLEDIPQRALARSIERGLIQYDYLPVKEEGAVDLTIGQKNNQLILRHHAREILQIPVKDFSSGLGATLNKFAVECDRFPIFRQLTFFSLLLGYPLLLYILFHGFIRLLLYLFVDARKAAAAATIIIFITSLAILVQFYFAKSIKVEKEDVPQALESDRWQKRVKALRIIQEYGLEIGNEQSYLKILKSPKIPERYWLAKALANSRKPETYQILVALLNDANPNVVSMAFYALAQRRETRVVKEIIRLIKESDNWYSQLYAYRTLRALGWNQTRPH